jgi:hypothetical protein
VIRGQVNAGKIGLRHVRFANSRTKSGHSAPPNMPAIAAPHSQCPDDRKDTFPSSHHSPLQPVQPPRNRHGGGDGQDADRAAYRADHSIAAEHLGHSPCRQ